MVSSYALDLPEEGTRKRQKFDNQVAQLVNRITRS